MSLGYSNWALAGPLEDRINQPWIPRDLETLAIAIRVDPCSVA